MFAHFAASSMEVSSGPVVEGVWNSNFSNALAAARSSHKPLVMVWSSDNCLHCSRLERAMEDEKFLVWQRARKLPMLFVRASPRDPAFADSRNFAGSGPQELEGYPYICVWWPKPDGTEYKRNFCGRRGKMSKSRDPSLVGQLVDALDRALIDYLPVGTVQMLADEKSAGVKCVSVKTEGASGVAYMEPESGEITEGGEVWLSVRPRPAATFAGWRGPDGSVVSRHRRMRVSFDMPDGCYRAVFRRKADCRPPEVVLPTTSICIRAGCNFSYALQASEASFPMRFAARNLPVGFTLDEYDGIVSGVARETGTNVVELTFYVNDPARTVRSGALTIVVN